MSVPPLRVAAAQINPTVGDLEGNTEKILAFLAEAEDAGCDLVCFSELAVTGYPPEDLLLKEGFIRDARLALETIAAATKECVAIVGTVVSADDANFSLGSANDARFGSPGGDGRPVLANAAAILSQGQIQGLIAKRLLPNYAVFDEQRWFVPGQGSDPLFLIAGNPVGVTVCEDLWSAHGPAVDLADRGCSLIVSLNASPFSIGQHEARRQVLSERVEETGAAILYVNQVGGQDELVFDGSSMLISDEGLVKARAASFVEALMIADIHLTQGASLENGDVRTLTQTTRSDEPRIEGDVADDQGRDAEIYDALVLGTRDYLKKNGFSDAVIGLSGGIDSTLVAVIAVDALGPEHVRGISMPSRYSSDHSKSDAVELAKRLGISIDTVSIEEAHGAYGSMLGGVLGGEVAGLTDENLQSRLRGVLLMGISNATGAMVLTTGNKSELATGYSTLYGDSAGGFAVIKDVPKTLVYDLCRFRNERAAQQGTVQPIAVEVIDKPPSAELRLDQKDEDSLPPYELLDPILAAYVEGDQTGPELIARGHDPAIVARVVQLVDTAEYKRRQMPPGVKITSKAFGKDRRMPITNRYRPDMEPS